MNDLPNELLASPPAPQEAQAGSHEDLRKSLMAMARKDGPLEWADRVLIGRAIGVLATTPEFPPAPQKSKDRLLVALERAARAESALRALADECDNDSTVGWEDRMTSRIAHANHVLSGKCDSCGGSGWLGGPSFYNPGEGGVPCPDCAAPVAQPATEPPGLKNEASHHVDALFARTDVSLSQMATEQAEAPRPMTQAEHEVMRRAQLSSGTVIHSGKLATQPPASNAGERATIKPWEERVKPRYPHSDPSTWKPEVHLGLTESAMKAEIDELRAALASKPVAPPAREALANNDVDLLLRQVFELCEETEGAPETDPKNEHQRGFEKGRRFEAKSIRRAIGTWFQDAFCGRSFMGEPDLANKSPLQGEAE